MGCMTGCPGADPQLYRPRPELAGFVEYFGYWQPETGEPHRSRALPRGAATVIIDVSGRQRVDFYAADGHTRLKVPPAFIAGAGTASYVTSIDASQAVVTIHFRPAGALPFLGVPLGELENSCVGLDGLWGRHGASLHERLIATPSPADRVALLEAFLLQRLESHDQDPHRGVRTVLSAIAHDPSMRISEAQTMTGLSPRRLAAAFRAEVGLAPKSYQRVRRLQAALSMLDAGAAHGATIAADLGYFDQAHFVREFRSFTAMSPTQYLARRSWLPSHVELAAAC
jgi:AraC-like DNA-binding protein